MMRSSKVAIVGAGFSGLTLAWHLCKSGLSCEIFESEDRVGGLIQTEKDQVLVEAAAHALLASQSVEKLFQDLDLEMCEAGHQSKAKWIFRKIPRRWPLRLSETWQLLRFVFQMKKQKPWPQSQESVQGWIRRLSNESLNDFLVAPGLQGIYGTSTAQLSARLVIGSVLTKELKSPRGKKRGSVAPRDGMQSLLETLRKKLEARGVIFHLGSSPSLESLQQEFSGVVLATSMTKAQVLLKSKAPNLALYMGDLPSVCLSTVTIGYKKKSSRIRGFGCLFPEKENFESLGVLFNTDIFPDRGPLNSETWIFANDFSGQTLTEILSKVRKDRQRIAEGDLEIEFMRLHRRPKVLPLYGKELETLLEAKHLWMVDSQLPLETLDVFLQGARVRESSQPLYLTGNYLGGIGLTKILDYNQRLAARIAAELRELK